MISVLQQNYLTGTVRTDQRSEGHVEWECPSNIALIKYWGKKDVQLPVNPSLSITLSKSFTSLSAEYSIDPAGNFLVDYTFEGSTNHIFRNRVVKYLEDMAPYFPFLNHIQLKIHSRNTFPHSSGIASSASFFGAISLALCSIENQVKGNTGFDSDFFRKASYFARLGSGSACRSIFGPLVLWGETPDFPGSSDEMAVPVGMEQINPEFRDFRDSILIVSSSAKSVSSSRGHELMKFHPFLESRTKQAGRNMKCMLNALAAGELFEFTEIAEAESLALHALMMTSNPGYILMRPETIRIIENIKKFRCDTGLPVGFSLDAGPNVHLLYPFAAEERVRRFIDAELVDLCENGRVIHDFAGKGPVCRIS